MFSPSGLGSYFRVTRTPGAANRALVFMTGVHWLLAHCSVLKVRTPPALPFHTEKPPAHTGGLTSPGLSYD